jgi:predicted secreted hydrolase
VSLLGLSCTSEPENNCMDVAFDFYAAESSQDTPVEEATPSVPSAVRLPADAAPHDELVEWWYWTGHVEAADGPDGGWGFELAIFQQDLISFGGSGTGFMCHVALMEKASGRHLNVSRLVLEPGQITHQAPVILDVFPCFAELDGAGNDHIVGVIEDAKGLQGPKGTWRFDLRVAPQKPVISHGGDGIIAMGEAGGDSFYYSYTRMEASGQIETPEGSFEVSGQAWMDHQWGDFDINAFKGWDWWSVQLDDGWELMLYEFRDWDDVIVVRAGTLVDPDGKATDLVGVDAYSIESHREWPSPYTDGTYPLDWSISIPEYGWALDVRVDVDDQEMPNLVQNYWEGAVTVTGTRGETPVTGVGYVELTGYASDLGDPK